MWWPVDASSDHRTISEDDSEGGTPESYGKLVDGQIRGVQVLETLCYDPAFDSNIQAYADMMTSIFAGSTTLQYLNGTGYIPASDGRSGPMIAIWWTQLISSYLAHYKSFVMGLDNPSTHTMFWVNSIALRVTIELGMGVDKGQLLYKEKTSSVPCFQESKAYTLYLTVNYLSHRSCL